MSENTILKSNDTKELIKQSNQERLRNPNRWIFLELHHQGQVLLVKSFGTSIQILRKNGINYPSGWDLSVKKWKELILNALSDKTPT